MAFREFTDSAGAEWHVYDVIPRDERRQYDRRASGSFDDPSVDRRVHDDRRATVGRRSSLANVGSGWLCFERASDRERRRLSPIPQGWLVASAGELESYCSAARHVPVLPDSASGDARR